MGLVSNLNIGSSLSNITGVINQFVVAPVAAFGLAGFVFNAMGEATSNLSSDITDHYAEDNTALQDQIACRPKRITLKGYVGEVVYNGAGSAPSAVNTLAEKLTSLTSFLPAITAGATQVQQAVNNPASASFSSLLSTTSNIYGLVQNALGVSGSTKNQQNAYNYFKALWQSKTIMSVQTPWEFVTNMAIEHVVAIQPENSIWISDFAVTLKQLNFATTETMAPQSNMSAQQGNVTAGSTPATLSGAAAVQQAPVTNLGNISGAVPAITSLPKGAF